MRRSGPAWLIALFASAAWAVTHAETNAAQPRAVPEEAPTQWVVFPPPLKEGDPNAALIRRFYMRAVESRFPQLEYAGERIGGLIFRLRDDSGEKSAVALDALQALPGIAGAMPLPSASAMLRSQSKALIGGGLTSQAVGLIVRHRSAAKRMQAKAGRPLEGVDLARMSAIVGLPVVASRAMSGAAHAIAFARPVNLYEAQLAALRLEQDPDVAFASPDGYVVPAMASSDPGYALQWNLTSPVAGINVQPAWDITIGSSNIVVGIVDSGILGHPDFQGRLAGGYDFVSDPARARDGDGRDADPTDPGDWRPAGACGAGTPAQDSTWHGTHVAGIIGATGDNGIGVAGVNWRSPMQPARALGRCGGVESDILDALSWSAGLAVPNVPNNPTPSRVINMSLAGQGNCLVERVAWQSAILDALVNGATVVVAAGNEGESALTHVPASCVGTIKVAAVGPTGDKTPYSNYSSAIEIAAPGGDMRSSPQGGILSTLVTGTQSDPGNATWLYDQGTSMAAPHVTGVASLMLSARPDLTVAQVRDVIRATARPFPAGTSCAASRDCGLGVVDAGKAVDFARQIAARINFSDLWWVPQENGWGMTLNLQGDILFGAWFTYASNGDSTWYVMSNMSRVAQDFFAGDIYQITGTPFDHINGAPAAQQVTRVGQAIVAFFGVGFNVNPNQQFDSALFYYQIGSTVGLKPIERQLFAGVTACGFTTGSRAGLANYQDLWWNARESGWGVNITHQADTLFAAWFTYDSDGKPMWLVGTNVGKTGPGTYSGRLYITTGVPFSQINGAQSMRTVEDVGQVTFTFTDGEHARMDYTVSGITGSKQIERQTFSSPLSTCHS